MYYNDRETIDPTYSRADNIGGNSALSYTAAAVDFDGDGALDIIALAPSKSGGRVSIYWNELEGHGNPDTDNLFGGNIDNNLLMDISGFGKKISENEVRKMRNQFKISPVFRLVDTCAGEFNSKTPYLYSTYDWNLNNEKYCEANPTNKNKILEEVWKYSSDADTHTVETHIYRLRKKIEDKFSDVSFIINNKKGYFI